MNLDQFTAICPKMPFEKAKLYLPYLLASMEEFEINTPAREAAFIAQLSHETGSFKWLEELASGKAYEGRKDLGNIETGDGIRFKGRGYIMITGRANYRAAGKALSLDLVNDPELAADPDVAARTAGWFWSTHKLNALADQKNFVLITRRINGGLNGYKDRLEYYQRALKVLECE